MLGAQPAWKPPLLCAPPPAAPGAQPPPHIAPASSSPSTCPRPRLSTRSPAPCLHGHSPDALSPRCPSSTRPTCPVSLCPQPPRAHGLSWLHRPQPFHLPEPSTPFPGPSTPSQLFLCWTAASGTFMLRCYSVMVFVLSAVLTRL